MSSRLTFEQVAELARSLGLIVKAQNGYHLVGEPFLGGAYRTVYDRNGTLVECYAYLCGVDDERRRAARAATLPEPT